MKKGIFRYLLSFAAAVCLSLGVLSEAVYAQTGSVMQTDISTIELNDQSATQAKYDKIRKRLRTAFDNFDTNVDFTDINLTYDTLEILFDEVLSDKKYFYVERFSYWERNDTKKITAIEISYICSKSNAPKYKEKFEKALNSITKNVKDSWTDLQKIIYLHDTLVVSTSYRADKNIDFTAYGTLVNHIGCCTGYSIAYSMLLKEVGIKSSIAINDDHMWNLVWLNKKWYNVDCTADDPAINGNAATITDLCDHSCMLVSSAALTDDLHKNMKSIYKASSTTYEGFVWKDCIKPMNMYGNKIIFSTSEGKIYCYDLKTNKNKLLTSVEDHWILWSSYTEYQNGDITYQYNPMSYVSVVRYGSVIYYNTSKAVYSYDLKTGKKALVKKYDPQKNNNMNIYGLKIKGTKLYGYFSVSFDVKDKAYVILKEIK